MFRAFETGDCGDLAEFIADDYLNHESVDDGRSSLRGPEEVRDTIKWLRNSFSDLTFEEQEIIEQNDRLVAFVTMRGKQVGPFFDIAPKGKSFAQRQVHFFRCQGGKVLEHRALRDDLGLRLQLEGSSG
jgi:predicted ester cyclase